MPELLSAGDRQDGQTSATEQQNPGVAAHVLQLHQTSTSHGARLSFLGQAQNHGDIHMVEKQKSINCCNPVMNCLSPDQKPKEGFTRMKWWKIKKTFHENFWIFFWVNVACCVILFSVAGVQTSTCLRRSHYGTCATLFAITQLMCILLLCILEHKNKIKKKNSDERFDAKDLKKAKRHITKYLLIFFVSVAVTFIMVSVVLNVSKSNCIKRKGTIAKAIAVVASLYCLLLLGAIWFIHNRVSELELNNHITGIFSIHTTVTLVLILMTVSTDIEILDKERGLDVINEAIAHSYLNMDETFLDDSSEEWKMDSSILDSIDMVSKSIIKTRGNEEMIKDENVQIQNLGTFSKIDKLCRVSSIVVNGDQGKSFLFEKIAHEFSTNKTFAFHNNFRIVIQLSLKIVPDKSSFRKTLLNLIKLKIMSFVDSEYQNLNVYEIHRVIQHFPMLIMIDDVTQKDKQKMNEIIAVARKDYPQSRVAALVVTDSIRSLYPQDCLYRLKGLTPDSLKIFTSPMKCNCSKTILDMAYPEFLETLTPVSMAMLCEVCSNGCAVGNQLTHQKLVAIYRKIGECTIE